MRSAHLGKLKSYHLPQYQCLISRSIACRNSAFILLW